MGKTKIHMFYTAQGRSRLFRDIVLAMLDYWDIKYEEGVGYLTAREIEILEKKGFVVWDRKLQTFKPAGSGRVRLTIRGGNSIILLFAEEGEWVIPVKILPKNMDERRLVEEKIIPVLRMLERGLK